ncbi:hypothetical protein CN324_26395 [Bacillus anthracis]|nr:hypothetical protein B2J90_15200 [Bacillus cereus]PEF66802.1 hypothetical protein CON33_13935 [Bacillus anthracis]PHA11981.1 hypothetical protein COE65_09595 [Bacillus sp. AFS051223]PET34400.1 hypothetical protein CN518_07110 [Bacillus anthracis]PFA96277.1 hypothetical protein CN385_23670 [Bacillus anthracis]
MSVTSGHFTLSCPTFEALFIRLIFYEGTEWLGFRTLFSSCNLLYQVIKELYIVRLSKVFGYADLKEFVKF